MLARYTRQPPVLGCGPPATVPDRSPDRQSANSCPPSGPPAALSVGPIPRSARSGAGQVRSGAGQGRSGAGQNRSVVDPHVAGRSGSAPREPLPPTGSRSISPARATIPDSCPYTNIAHLGTIPFKRLSRNGKGSSRAPPLGNLRQRMPVWQAVRPRGRWGPLQPGLPAVHRGCGHIVGVHPRSRRVWLRLRHRAAVQREGSSPQW